MLIFTYIATVVVKKVPGLSSYYGAPFQLKR